MLKLGDLAKDRVSGFQGVVVARTEWLNGCVRLTLQPRKVSPLGKVYESETFDEHQLQVVKGDVVPSAATRAVSRTGGPQNDKVALRRN